MFRINGYVLNDVLHIIFSYFKPVVKFNSLFKSRKYGIVFSPVSASTFPLTATCRGPKDLNFWKPNLILSVPYLVTVSASQSF